ncbi:ABC-F family ATP-binding cassette domain-containing protein [Bartonella sp. 1-1C]|uniref:ABC-F family ATP-binding cassette domain-containing protein n=1 Tax=Bartonella sp. 1-1C TaxID=515256 RepID=UPI0001F4C141|nr:ABC-F family ATP-binding cassette domain-containing protein [Bartonella sp. 1-1C]ATO57535.1 ATP-binding cassette, subfamily F, member 3 [Bartonella sp. 1-1C]CBI80713.1 ABC transporter, ATP-binding protein [Bartonella sp. 1-1C]
MLVLNDITIRMAGYLLIDRANIAIPSGSKTGFVGNNGTGKSTLFRVITGDISPENGEVLIPQKARIGLVSQEAPTTEQSLLETVLDADKELINLIRESKTATDPIHIANIHTRLSDINAHSAKARASKILSGLGFDPHTQQKPLSSFSGGWRMRIALATVLFTEPDLLLLDEPTNYLDIEGTLWLIEYIHQYPHTTILISHDRDFLNKTVNSIMHLENNKLTFWRGNYDQFKQQKAETTRLQQKEQAKQEAQKKHMEDFINRFRAKASKSRQAQSRLKALEKLKLITPWETRYSQSFTFPIADRPVASPIIALSNINIGYEKGKPILKELNLRIDNDDRIALLGSNGNGKSTLAKLLAGRLQPEQGTITLAPHLKIAFFTQHQLDDLIPEQNAIEHMRYLMPEQSETKIRSTLAQMGLLTEKMMVKVKELSGGEKVRLLMGLIVFKGPHLLILDEPTNHLDIDSREELIHALNNFNGAVILISHDRYLIEATMDQFWLVKNKTVLPYKGDINTYRVEVLGFSPKKETKTSPKKEHFLSKNEQRKINAQKRSLLAPLRKQIAETETVINSLQKQIKQLDEELIPASSHNQFSEKAKERAKVMKKLEEAETLWFALSNQYETQNHTKT